MQDQIPLLDQLFKLEQFLLIVMDDCRYDYFEREYPPHLGRYKGKLSMVRSPGSCTPSWARTMFPRMPDGVLMITANPGLGSASHFWQLEAHRYFAKIINAWDGSRWEPKYKKHEMEETPPNTMAKIYGENCDWDRTIVWFIQPHGPYMGPEQKLSIQQLWDMENGVRKPELMKKAYWSNLRWALPHVAACVERSPVSKVVVTADHGEAFGEQGVWGHPGHSVIPVLRNVPWLEIDK